MILEEVEMPPRSAARCAGRRPLGVVSRIRRDTGWRRIAFWSAVTPFVLLLPLAARAQVPPEEEALRAAIAARDAAEAALAEEIGPELWDAFAKARSVASARQWALVQKVGLERMHHLTLVSADTEDLHDRLKEVAPEEARMGLDAQMAKLRVEDALEVIAPQEVARYRAAETMMDMAMAMYAGTFGTSMPDWVYAGSSPSSVPEPAPQPPPSGIQPARSPSVIQPVPVRRAVSPEPKPSDRRFLRSLMERAATYRAKREDAEARLEHAERLGAQRPRPATQANPWAPAFGGIQNAAGIAMARRIRSEIATLDRDWRAFLSRTLGNAATEEDLDARANALGLTDRELAPFVELFRARQR